MTQNDAFAFGNPVCSAAFKQRPEDFQVEEVLGFEPAGEGEHLFLWVEKRGLNTNEVLRELATCYGIAPKELGVAGLKDRQALTRQWVSLPLAVKQEFDPGRLQHPDIRILRAERHQRKLKRGVHKGNRFRITLRQLQGSQETLTERLEQIRRQGVPNYFGPQRFGAAGDNVAQALAWFRGEHKPKGRHLKGIYLSAARSWLFNTLLSRRVAAGNWNRILDGELLALDGSSSWFRADPADSELESRLDTLDIHPTGPMWGKGDLPAHGEVATIEQQLAADFPELCEGLAQRGLHQERRALRMNVHELELSHGDDGSLVIEFRLGRGSYATAVLRELLAIIYEHTPE